MKPGSTAEIIISLVLLCVGAGALLVSPSSPTGGFILILVAWVLYRLAAWRRSSTMRSLLRGVLLSVLTLLPALGVTKVASSFLLAQVSNAQFELMEEWMASRLGFEFEAVALTLFEAPVILGVFAVMVMVLFSWGAWRMGRKQFAMPTFRPWLALNLIGSTGWVVLIGLLWRSLVPLWLLLAASAPQAQTESFSVGKVEEEAPFTAHWVAFPSGEYGLFARLPDSLVSARPGDRITARFLVCPNAGDVPITPSCVPVGGILSPGEALIVDPVDVTASAVWARPSQARLLLEIKKIDKRSGRIISVWYRRVPTDVIHPAIAAPRLSIDYGTNTHDGAGIDIAFRFDVPARLGAASLWIMPTSQGPLFEVPQGKRRILIPGMAEWQDPLKPYVAADWGSEAEWWSPGRVVFHYRIDRQVLDALLRQGDLRYGRRIPMRVRLEVPVFGLTTERDSRSHPVFDGVVMLELPQPDGHPVQGIQR